MEDTLQGLQIGIDNMWLLIAAFLVMFMQPGFAMVEAGLYTLEEHRKHFDEKHDGLLYWFIVVLGNWFHPDVW